MNNEQIPKIVHYCWLGGKNKPRKIEKFIGDWQKKLPDYKIIEWNEQNFPVNFCRYTEEAYKQKKYAFVSDVVRLYALKEYGGFYFDTDIELKKNLDNYIDNDEVIMAFESDRVLMTGFIAAKKNHNFICEWIDSYKNLSFIRADGTLDETTNTSRVTNMLVNKGLVLDGKEQNLNNGIHIYEKEIFGAYDVDNSHFVNNENTVLIHHCNGSWTSIGYRVMDKCKRCVAIILGINKYKRLRKWVKKIKTR